MARLLAIEIENLHYRYPDGTEALRGVNLQVPAGETLCLLGPNGAGKSTLLLHLNGLLRGSGKVEVLGQAVENSHLQHLRQKVGLVFENPNDQLIMPTVFDEVAFAALNAGHDQEQVRRRVAITLDSVGMSGQEQRCPQDLSLGQKKRVALASVLVTECELLVLDEPSLGLDPWGRQELMALIARLPMTKIIATHDVEVARRLATRAAFLRDGVILTEGSPEEILALLPREETAPYPSGVSSH